jgi:hypothetical protein
MKAFLTVLYKDDVAGQKRKARIELTRQQLKTFMPLSVKLESYYDGEAVLTIEQIDENRRK